jgi:hypothetical protein
MKMLQKYGIWCIPIDVYHSYDCASNLDKERVTCVEKGLNFGSTGFYIMTVVQLTRFCSLSSSFWPKSHLLKWNTHPIPKSAPNDFSLFPKIKSTLKVQRFQNTEDKKM